MTTRQTFRLLLAMYRKHKMMQTAAENEAMERAIKIFAAAEGIEDWNWGE